MQERLTAARRLVQKELPKADRKLLKGSRWLWCKSLENLTAAERAELQSLRTKFPELARLADQRESLLSLFEDRSITTSETAQQRLREWVTTARSLQLKPLDAFCQTVENGGSSPFVLVSCERQGTSSRFFVGKESAASALPLMETQESTQVAESRNWLPMIANYFTNRSSNGPTEGFNRGFRTILWQAYGMTNLHHIRLRILDRFNQPPTQLST